MNKSYKFRVYPNKKQEELIQKTFGCSRFIFNYYLAKRIEEYKKDKKLFSFYDCNKDLTKLKNIFEWLREPDSYALESSIKDLENAYNNFFSKIKNNNKNCGFPNFKSKKKNNNSYRTRNNNGCIYVLKKEIKLPKIGFIKAKISRDIKGKIVNATIIQTKSKKYFIIIRCKEENKYTQKVIDKKVGIDLGIKEFIVTSDGQYFKNNKYLIKSEKRIKKLQKNLSRKSIGSSNREKTKIKLAKKYEEIKNQRCDFLNKISSSLINKYDVICVESLMINSMIKNHNLAKLISDASWGEFVRQLQYKAEWNNKTIQKVGIYFSSSQMCSKCGQINNEVKNLSIREWKCKKCETIHDRDINAAINILNEGVRLLNN